MEGKIIFTGCRLRDSKIITEQTADNSCQTFASSAFYISHINDVRVSIVSKRAVRQMALLCDFREKYGIIVP